MSGWFEQGMWLEAYRVLASGEPPILFQLLVFNTIMMVFWHMRRRRGLWTIRRETAIGLQVADIQEVVGFVGAFENRGDIVKTQA